MKKTWLEIFTDMFQWFTIGCFGLVFVISLFHVTTDMVFPFLGKLFVWALGG